jgi:MSHA biogenesis protein MshP
MNCPRPRGFALPTAIFLLVILAALGAFILTISSSQQMGSALDMQGARAYQAARAGIEWGLFQSLHNGSCAAGSLTFPGTALSDFTAAVACTPSTATELVDTVTLHSITATACNQPPCPNGTPGTNYVERQLTAVLSR